MGIFIRNPLQRLFVVITIITMAGCTGYISKTDLLHRIESGNAPPIIDARTSWEYEEGHIPGAINIPFYSVIFCCCEIPSSEGEAVVVYCEHGPRAGITRSIMRVCYFGSVVYLEGHMESWREEGFPIEKSPEN